MPENQTQVGEGVKTLFFILGCLIFAGCNSNKLVATVGSYKIFEKDVAYRDKVAQFYLPKESNKLGLNQLVRAFTSAEILKRNGHPVTKSTLKAEAKRIETNTKNRNGLEKIKSIFGNDTDGYLKDYVLPVYVDRVLYFDFFLHDLKIQKESKDQVKKYIRQHRKSQSLSTGSQTETVSMDDPFFKTYLINLKPGQIYPTPIDDQEVWKVVRLKKRIASTNRYEIESVTFPKAPFGPWYEKQSAKVKVTYLH